MQQCSFSSIFSVVGGYRRWNNVSIAKKLYFVVGIMALLIAGELVTLRFAMKKLSAGRAFVGAESLWSKAQKNAVFSLQRFGFTKNNNDFQAYLDYLKVPEGDHLSRMELQKSVPDLEIVRQGFLQGHIHPDDIEPVVELLRNFYWVSYLSKAIAIWKNGDELLDQLKVAGQGYHDAILSGDIARSDKLRNEIKDLNVELTKLEEDFSFILGQGSRWLEHVVLTLLTLAVLTVETVGLTLAFLTARAISRGLNELSETAQAIGQGHFSKKVIVHSQDEIGVLGEVVNSMGDLLKKSYTSLEDRVKERTLELEKLASENAKLYEEAKQAVQSRDEFLSIASHELKTPLTSLYLQLQRIERSSSENSVSPEFSKIAQLSHVSLKLTKRLTTLLDELLDLTRLRVGKLQLHRSECNLVSIVSDVIMHLSAEASKKGAPISFQAPKPVNGSYDSMRVEQIVTNLLSNAIKYGEGKPIDVSVHQRQSRAEIKVRDHGPGIPDEQKAKIFERFERGTPDPNISGLGLGLYITQQIVKAHGGEISVESAVGTGTTFTVLL